MSYQVIADHIMRSHVDNSRRWCHSEQASFAEDYHISVQAIHRAFKRGVAREMPRRSSAKLDSERCEEMFLSLQPGCERGCAQH